MKNKVNKPLIITAVTCAVIIALIIVVCFFLDCLIGHFKLNGLIKEIEECDEILITAPLYYDAYSSGAEAIVTGDEAEGLISYFLEAVNDRHYDGTVDGSLGFWDTRIIFKKNNGSCTVYLDGEGFYIAEKTGYRFVPDDTEKYLEFYSYICDLLENS